MQHLPNLHDLGNFFFLRATEIKVLWKILWEKKSDCNIIFIVKEVRVMNDVARNRAEVEF